jgi:hypothetical protein
MSARTKRPHAGAPQRALARVALSVVLLLAVRPMPAGDSRSLFPAFPGAEGSGAYTPGGRGGKVLFVTTLADYDPGKEKPIPGSLRRALLTKGPRTVLFRVGGNIELKRDLWIGEPFITIAGQSATGGGICLKNASLLIQTHDVILRHLRIRPGDVQHRELDAISCSGQNVIIDHCSTSWAIDETLSTNGNSADVTVSWCLITESLNRSYHHKGAHGYGSLISGPGAISYHHNIYAYHRSRNPRGGDGLLDFRNNLVCAWGDRPGYSGDDRLRLNYVGNVLQPLSWSKSAGYAFLPGGLRPRIYIADNLHESSAPANADNWLLIRPPAGATAEEARERMRAGQPFASADVTTEPAQSAYRRVLDEAGATRPDRDAVDARVVAAIRAGAGRIINSQSEVGGWPRLAAGEAPPDSDDDGMPDAWETAHGLDPRRAADPRGDRDGDGYTDLEEFLNGTSPTQKDAWIDPPAIVAADGQAFIGATRVSMSTRTPGAEIRYTLDGASPDRDSTPYGGPFELKHSATVRARAFSGPQASHSRNVELMRLELLPPQAAAAYRSGLRYEYFEAEKWTGFPVFSGLKPVASGDVPEPTLELRRRDEGFGLRFSGLFRAPRAGLYRFYLRCSPRGQVVVHDAIVESQGRKREHSAPVALEAGLHPFVAQIYFSSDVDKTFEVSVEEPGTPRRSLAGGDLFHVDAP